MKLCPLEGHRLTGAQREERRDRHVINYRGQIKDEEVPASCRDIESKNRGFHMKIKPTADSPADIYLATHEPQITKHCSQASKHWSFHLPWQVVQSCLLL